MGQHNTEESACSLSLSQGSSFSEAGHTKAYQCLSSSGLLSNFDAENAVPFENTESTNFLGMVDPLAVWQFACWNRNQENSLQYAMTRTPHSPLLIAKVRISDTSTCLVVHRVAPMRSLTSQQECLLTLSTLRDQRVAQARLIEKLPAHWARTQYIRTKI